MIILDSVVLAAAALADQAEAFAAADVEAHVVDRQHLPATAAEKS